MATIEQPQIERGRRCVELTLTERAAEKVKELMAEEPAGEAEVLRVAIQGGGCSGFQYALGFDRGAAEGDSELESHGVTVVVDPSSAPYLQGATVDFVESLRSPGSRSTTRTPSGSADAARVPGRRRRRRRLLARSAAAAPAARS